MMKVLIIDDDRKLFELLKQYLADNAVNAEHASDGNQGLGKLRGGSFDAVLLDIMMPGPNGLEVLRSIRGFSSVPVIMLTAKGDETDRVVGLELGADDYLPKPFSPRELLARLRAVLRRSNTAGQGELLSGHGVVVDVAARTVKLGDLPVELTGLEFDLLLALMRRKGRVVARGDLMTLAGRSDVTVNDRAVDVHVSHLRRKLATGEDGTELIRTVRGVGYVFVGDES
ncbi:MAG TPA: response regulator transcription factor [Polyangiaceae bacterium]|nr:response regulator transcription factor [Polyangiaceae bacterium]